MQARPIRLEHYQDYAGNDVADYHFMATDTAAADNRWLREAMQEQIPIIYFLRTSPGRYQPIIPTFIVGWHPERLRVQLAFGAIVGASAQSWPARGSRAPLGLREVQGAVTPSIFRDAVLTAYRGRCAISRLPNSDYSTPLTSLSSGRAASA